jgi:quercetin dioxygenase-like cupin family protein
MHSIESRKETISEFQAELLKLEQVEPPTDHHFSDGMYGRVMHMPAGMVVSGRTHRKDHLFIVCKGAIRIANDEGSVLLTAPAVIETRAGAKRVLYAVEDSACMTVHKTDLTDIAAIEDDVLEPEPVMLFGPGNKLKVLESK